MNKLLLGLFAVLTLSGCGSLGLTVRPIEITKDIEPLTVLHPPLPDGVTWEEVEFTVLTPDIMRELIARLDRGEIDESRAVFAAITSKGYEHLSLNMAELKRFIADQKAVIMYYRETVPDEVFIPKETEEE